VLSWLLFTTLYRLFLRKLKLTLKIPVLALVDSDPYGLKILSVYMKGSMNMSYDSRWACSHKAAVVHVCCSVQINCLGRNPGASDDSSCELHAHEGSGH
jgi:hypothetical protein